MQLRLTRHDSGKRHRKGVGLFVLQAAYSPKSCTVGCAVEHYASFNAAVSDIATDMVLLVGGVVRGLTENFDDQIMCGRPASAVNQQCLQEHRSLRSWDIQEVVIS